MQVKIRWVNARVFTQAKINKMTQVKIRQVDSQGNHKNFYSYKHQATFIVTKLGVTADVVFFFRTNLGCRHHMHIGG